MKVNVYQWLDKYFVAFLIELGMPAETAEEFGGLIGAHGDKTRQYARVWSDAKIPYEEGAAVYLLTHIPPYNREVRCTIDGEWSAPHTWVIVNFHKFKTALDASKAKTNNGDS